MPKFHDRIASGDTRDRAPFSSMVSHLVRHFKNWLTAIRDGRFSLLKPPVKLTSLGTSKTG